MDWLARLRLYHNNSTGMALIGLLPVLIIQSLWVADLFLGLEHNINWNAPDCGIGQGKPTFKLVCVSFAVIIQLPNKTLWKGIGGYLNFSDRDSVK